jgi:hypothetical protein
MVVQRPDKWEQRGRYKHGKAIVMKATTRSVLLCTFQPGQKLGPSNPHVGYYDPRGLTPVGKVKRIPKACSNVMKWKAEFYEKHPYFKKPTRLAGGKRRK